MMFAENGSHGEVDPLVDSLVAGRDCRDSPSLHCRRPIGIVEKADARDILGTAALTSCSIL